MATWTNISNAAVAVGGIPSSTTVTALRDNPSALAESASGAPVVFAGWHPYDKVSVGDGKTGVIYDFTVNGGVTSVTSPDFVDGYEYRFFGLIHALNTSATFQLYEETSAAYTSMNPALDTGYWFDFEISMPRVPKATKLIQGTYGLGGASAPVSYAAKIPNGLGPGFSGGSNNPQKLLRARFTLGSNSSEGKIWMFRRREYASLP